MEKIKNKFHSSLNMSQVPTIDQTASDNQTNMEQQPCNSKQIVRTRTNNVEQAGPVVKTFTNDQSVSKERQSQQNDQKSEDDTNRKTNLFESLQIQPLSKVSKEYNSGKRLREKWWVSLLLQSDVTEINLNSIGITDIDPFNPQLCTSITNLRLSGNRLTSSAVRLICQLPKLLKLNISNCGLSYVPIIPSDTQLSILNMSGNVLADSYGIESLFYIPSLKNLNISGCGISSIALTSFECSLKVISISQNPLDQPTVELIQMLRNIEIADFSQCKLTQIPTFVRHSEKVSSNPDSNDHNFQVQMQFSHDAGSSSFACDTYQNVTMLKLDGNNFSKDKNVAALFSLGKLEKLILDNCQIKSLGQFDPAKCPIKQLSLRANPLDQKSVVKVCLIPNLEELVLQECGLKQIPQFPPNSQVWKLNLGLNKFEDTSNIVTVFRMACLTVLSMSSTNLTTVGDFDPASSKLQNLNVAKNQLDAKSLCLVSQIPTLTQLEVHGNTVPKDALMNMFQLPLLEILNLNGTGITQIEPFDTTLSKINQLWVAGNSLDVPSVEIICSLPLLTKLNIRRCNFTCEQLGHVFGMVMLQQLEIGEDELMNNWPIRKGGKHLNELKFGSPSQGAPKNYSEVFGWLPNLTVVNDQMTNIFKKDELDVEEYVRGGRWQFKDKIYELNEKMADGKEQCRQLSIKVQENLNYFVEWTTKAFSLIEMGAQ